MTTPISEIMLETQRIKTLLEKVYNGAPWHGPTIREALHCTVEIKTSSY
jgi:hypothetical protein